MLLKQQHISTWPEFPVFALPRLCNTQIIVSKHDFVVLENEDSLRVESHAGQTGDSWSWVSEEQIRNRIKYKFGAEIFQEKRFKEAWQQEQELLSVSMLCHLEQAGLFTEVPVSAGNVQNTQNPQSLEEQTAKIHHYGQSFRIKRGIYVSIR